jgi:hypothetical protein
MRQMDANPYAIDLPGAIRKILDCLGLLAKFTPISPAKVEGALAESPG